MRALFSAHVTDAAGKVFYRNHAAQSTQVRCVCECVCERQRRRRRQSDACEWVNEWVGCDMRVGWVFGDGLGLARVGFGFGFGLNSSWWSVG